MAWRIVADNIGRAGGVQKRRARQQKWDEQFGAGNWAVGYSVAGQFMLQEEALEAVYYRSYEAHFRDHREDLLELLSLAKSLRNPHAEATTGVDLQVPAIMNYLTRQGLALAGEEVVDIGTWKGKRSHAISVRLSPLHIACIVDPTRTLEEWWQEEKCLAVRQDRCP